MKRILAVIVVLGLMAAPIPARATVVVDFSPITEQTGITLTDVVTLNGVTFAYENFDDPDDPDDDDPSVTATVDAAGVFGSPLRALLLSFDTPATSLNLAFSLLSVPEPDPIDPETIAGVINEALDILLYSGGSSVAVVNLAADFTAFGDGTGDATNNPSGGPAPLVYTGGPFDYAELYFNSSAEHFTVDALSYEAVPEASSMLVWAGLFGVGGCVYFRRKCRRTK